MRPEDQSEETLLLNIIEEAGELVQAATKLLRVFRHDTPVTELDAREHLIEEMADVLLCIKMKTTEMEDIEIAAIQREKYRRWRKRINEEETE